MTRNKLHYRDWMRNGKTLCGRVIRRNTRVTGNLHEITCVLCSNSPYLDSELGNMTHAGH